ncbi:hypothetical protein M427DRAFT_154348 [Gonapodya prolifera JEL478]|uniref:Uncharacterized protein n=1 Tax=Gonapodya prolifera (strain JEL478) TaxID=1344416 RepID=A0A139AJX4_GONPJ|nr:hypothetical protein M427DRAFT_154348 [Gonapodya prolifera JEL478]|eukprot:KXS16715.1 hypothetical protein M427DRAFT_154348 [Gonapodya prolifera JEL478]
MPSLFRTNDPRRASSAAKSNIGRGIADIAEQRSTRLSRRKSTRSTASADKTPSNHFHSFQPSSASAPVPALPLFYSKQQLSSRSTVDSSRRNEKEGQRDYGHNVVQRTTHKGKKPSRTPSPECASEEMKSLTTRSQPDRRCKWIMPCQHSLTKFYFASSRSFCRTSRETTVVT